MAKKHKAKKAERHIGICALCQRERELRDSHFLPRRAYLGRQHVILTYRAVRVQERQIRDYVLCAECEHRLNINEEDYFFRWARRASGFRLLEATQNVAPIAAHPDWRLYFARDLGVDIDRLVYFGLSIFWRASIREWRISVAPWHTTRLELGARQEPIRQYLLGAPLERFIHVAITVAPDELTQLALGIPAPAMPDNPIFDFGFGVNGVNFRVLRAEPNDDTFGAVCSVHIAGQPIIVADQEVRLRIAMERLEIRRQQNAGV